MIKLAGGSRVELSWRVITIRPGRTTQTRQTTLHIHILLERKVLKGFFLKCSEKALGITLYVGFLVELHGDKLKNPSRF